MDGDNLTVNHQYSLPISKAARDQEYVPDSIVRKMPHKHSAINLAVTTAGLDDQDVYAPLGIPASVWSRIKKGDVSMDAEKIPEFQKLVNNDIYLRWINFRCGYECKPILSTLEQQLAEAQEQLREKEKENEILRGVLRK